MTTNPLQRYFRRPALWVKLPTLGKWYSDDDVVTNENQEVQVFGITAIDEIMLNTPDALFNGYALESVIKSCVPEIKQPKLLCQPDLEAIFVGIKSATNNGKFDITSVCPKCKHDNTFEIQCNHILDSMTYIEDSDTCIDIDGNMRVYVKPYDLTMRNIIVQRQLEERKVLDDVEKDAALNNNMVRASAYAKSIEKLSRLTFKLVADSVTKIEILDNPITVVTDKEHISEWLVNVNKNISDAIIGAVTTLNNTGPIKTTPAQCEMCQHQWTETLNFDPTLFFSRR